MAKYIDADKLRAEIKFAKSVYSHPNRVIHGVADGFRQDGRAAMCDDILEKIDSLQQRRSDVDLEKEIHKKVLELHTAPCYDELASFARHFYELGQKDAANKYDEIEYNRQRAEEQKPNIEICPHSIKSKSYSMQKEQEGQR